jgi:hypothetical protein
MELQGDRETVVFKSLPCAKNDSLNLEVIHQSQSNEALSPVLVQSVGYFPAIGSGWILNAWRKASARTAVEEAVPIRGSFFVCWTWPRETLAGVARQQVCCYLGRSCFN